MSGNSFTGAVFYKKRIVNGVEFKDPISIKEVIEEVVSDVFFQDQNDKAFTRKTAKQINRSEISRQNGCGLHIAKNGEGQTQDFLLLESRPGMIVHATVQEIASARTIIAMEAKQRKVTIKFDAAVTADLKIGVQVSTPKAKSDGVTAV